MPAGTSDFLQRESTRRAGVYLVKGAAVVLVLFAVARLAPGMPSVAVALVWAALSLALAVGIVYRSTIGKVHKQHQYQPGSLLARLNSGRFITIIVAFAAAAVCVAGLILESPKWGGVQWGIAALGIPLFYVVYLVVRRFLTRQYEELYLVSRSVRWSIAITGVLLCAAYLVATALGPTPTFTSAQAAFLGAPQPFADSPSVLMSETGKLVALVDGATAYGLAQAGQFSVGIYALWRVALAASAFFGIAGFLGTCVLEFGELKHGFQELDAVRDMDASAPPVKRYVAAACILPIVLAMVFLAADVRLASVAQTQEYTAAESCIRERLGVVVNTIDGKYYDARQIEELKERLKTKSDALASEGAQTLVPLINDSFDKRVQNVDAYLDWYYSLPADYERLAQFFTGTVESGVREQLETQLNEGVDESELNEKLNYYLEQSKALEAELFEGLEACEVAEVPDWLKVSSEDLDAAFLDGPLEPTHKLLDAGTRMGISAGAGIVSGFIVKKVVERIAAKPVFTKIVSTLTKKLAVRGLLAAGGTAIAPIAGTAVGIGIGVAGDFLFLKADEAMNRESYKAELIAAIEESSTEMLEMVGAE